MIVVVLSDATASRIADIAGGVGLTASQFLSDRVEEAYGTGRRGLVPVRQPRSARKRIAAAKRAARATRNQPTEFND